MQSHQNLQNHHQGFVHGFRPIGGVIRRVYRLRPAAEAQAQNHRNQSKNHQRAQRIVAEIVFFFTFHQSTQMGFEARGRGKKVAETGVFAAHKTPNNAQNHQGRRSIAHVFMHGFAFGSEKQIGKHTAHQQPMKQADEAIPNLDFLRHFSVLNRYKPASAHFSMLHRQNICSHTLSAQT